MKWRRQREEELEEEIQSHLRMAIRDRMERGESAEEAEMAARREFGNVGLIKETTRVMWGWTLVALFGGSALLLACLGLYGVVSYGVGLRLREFAIRTALGAQAADIRRIVLTHALKLWIWGACAGMVLAWMAGRALKTQLYGVGSSDAVALGFAPALLLVMAMLAALGPARRAGHVDPAVTLRSD